MLEKCFHLFIAQLDEQSQVRIGKYICGRAFHTIVCKIVKLTLVWHFTEKKHQHDNDDDSGNGPSTSTDTKSTTVSEASCWRSQYMCCVAILLYAFSRPEFHLEILLRGNEGGMLKLWGAPGFSVFIACTVTFCTAVWGLGTRVGQSPCCHTLCTNYTGGSRGFALMKILHFRPHKSFKWNWLPHYYV